MKEFVNEIFAFQIDPPKGKNDPCLTYALYDDGTFSIVESAPFSMDEKRKNGQCFQAMDQNDIHNIEIFAHEGAVLLHDCPDMIAIPDFPGSSLTFSFKGQMIYGSYNLMDLKKASPEVKEDRDLMKKLEWNNKCVGLMSSYFDLIHSLNSESFSYKPNANYLDLIRPVPRFLFHLLHEDKAILLVDVNEQDEAIKMAEKDVFAEPNHLDGATYNACFVYLRRNLLKVLDECDDITSFDKAHLLMADELVAVSAEAISFSEAAYWIDMAYAYLLVSEKFILSERKAALLHAPVSPKTLLEDSKKDDKTAYLFFQNDGRSEWALIHISPIYFYLESVYSSAHPIVGKKENNPA